MVKAKVAISMDFLSAYARLPKGIQRKVMDFVSKFQNNPFAPGIHLEKLNGIDKRICSVRIDNTYRGIVLREEETKQYLLLWVDHHDEAYAWAARKRCDVNQKNGLIQLYEVKEKEKTVTVAGVNYLFGDVSDDNLLELGVPEEQIEYVKSFTNIDEFIASKEAIPQDAFENLSWLTEGIPLEEVLQLVMDQRGAMNADMTIAGALSTPSALRTFVVVEGEEELKRILEAPLEKWRVFLHPTQRDIVNRDYSGPARVLGGAGTGKTVVAMHRAKRLAGNLANTQRILFTTFTANLASDIKSNLEKICTVDELSKIEVVNLDAWVNQYLREAGFGLRVSYNEIHGLWEDAVSDSSVELPFSTAFYEEEWNKIVISQEALSLEKYVKASRSGRGTRLDRKKRLLVWKVFEAYQRMMRERGICDINTAMYECTKLLKNENSPSKYRSVIIDEGQDFSDAAYRMLRALVGEEHSNDIFVVGDSHQRIYRNRPTLSKCGVNVRGRSSILKINYRTTEEIRKYAFAVLNGISFDDLDGGEETGDECQSLTHGEAPIIKVFEDADAEFAYLKEEINRLHNNGVQLTDICVVSRTNKLLDEYSSRFNSTGIKTYIIKRDRNDDRDYDGLRIATMHRVKGLEFQYVFVVSANNKVIPLASAINNTDAVSRAESITSEKCLLYVALTRAQIGAYVTCYGKKSEFLK